VPWIINNTPAAFKAIGTAASPGTKTFALAGKVKRGGLVEVPMGITLREIVFDIGGGIQNSRAFKAIQIGGPSGGCIPASLADIPVDYEQLKAYGAMMGSGGLVVLDDTDCMVEIARYFMAFTQSESCGQCVPCRVGTLRMLEILECLTSGKGTMEDIEELKRLAQSVSSLSLCGLGKTAPNPVLSTLKYFHEEYIMHTQGRCPSLSCKALVSYKITDKCIGCTRCSQYCPVDAIPYTPYKKHWIDDSLCTRCDTCRQVCPSQAIDKTDREKPNG
ncbi:MAG: 4Fe-4S dicluster domain-containing protein, partial [Spirochaetaceae bacterium]